MSFIGKWHCEENSTPIIGVREGSALRVRGNTIELLGGKPAHVFEQDKPNAITTDDSVLTAFMSPAKPQTPAASAPKPPKP